jgi:hypothetical protein
MKQIQIQRKKSLKRSYMLMSTKCHLEQVVVPEVLSKSSLKTSEVMASCLLKEVMVTMAVVVVLEAALSLTIFLHTSRKVTLNKVTSGMVRSISKED